MSEKRNGEAHNTPMMTANEAAYRHPPPTYEELMGVYQTSVKGQEGPSAPDQPQLAYIDIMPRCISPGNIQGKVPPKFEKFSSILAGVNMWLRDNPGFRVWKCESIQRKLNSAPDGTLSYQLIEMIEHDSIFGYCVYIRGIRLWLTKSPSPGSLPQVLGLRNMQPSKMSIELPTHSYYSQGDEVVRNVGYMNIFSSFCGLQDTVKGINKKLASDPIPGSILTIETDSVKAYEGFSKDFDPDATCWHEDKIKFRRITQVVRIFYVQGPPAKEEIAVHDFEPTMLDVGSGVMGLPKFGNFQSTLDQINQWLPSNQDKRIVNIQQFDANVVKPFLGNISISSDSTDEFVSFTKTKQLARVLRLFSVTSASQMAAPTSYVTSRVFLPARTGSRSFENMVETMERVDAWLRVTGVPIYSVETVKYLYNEHRPDGADVTTATYMLHENTGKYWLTAVRVYFPCNYVEPDPSLLPPPPVLKIGSSSCVVL